MITNLLLYTAVGMINALLYVLPTAPALQGDAITALGEIAKDILQLSWFFPLDTMVEVFFAALAIELAIFSFRVLNWGLNKLRGSG